MNFFKQNPDVDILGSNVLTFNDTMFTASNGKIHHYPTLDKLIKFNLLFYNCMAHPTVMFRVAKIADMIEYNVKNPNARAFEDYELWLRMIHAQNPPKFANIGSVLLYLRKHSSNNSIGGIPIEPEIPMKVAYLTDFYI